jgi:HlyD family secretion protein
MSWSRRAIAALFVLGVALAVAASLRPRSEPPLQVQMAQVKRSSITRRVTAAGKLQAATTVKVSSNVTGDLLELPVKEGDLVAKGQFLGRIDSRRYAAQVRQQEAIQASASADLAVEKVVIQRLRDELRRVERLAAGGNASPAEQERALADLKAEEAKANAVSERIAQAQAALAEARHFLSLTTLYAPIDGVVVTRAKQVGERVRGSDLGEDVIVTIATLSAMEAKVEAGEHEVVHLRLGHPAEVEIDAFPDKKWPAEVIEVANNATIKNPGTEAEVTTFPVRLALRAQVPGALPGMSCQAAISTETHDAALVIPIQAVTVRPERELQRGDAGAAPPETSLPPAQKEHREPMRKLVFVVQGGTARIRLVETGLASESEIEIVSGLRDGESIVEGPYKVLSRDLKDGKPVKEAKPEGPKGEGRRP